MSSIIDLQPNNEKLLEADNYFELFLSTHSQISCNADDALLTLKGDYYFSLFSLCLVEVDSIEITDAYGELLRKKTSNSYCRELDPIKDINPSSFQNMKKILEDRICLVSKSENERMTEDLKRVLLSGGKRLRPALAWTVYNLLEGQKKHPIVPLLVMIELMHSVSLIHDDVVDSGMMRRGTDTINKTTGNKAAVQSGDFVLGRAMELLKVYKGTGIDERLAHISNRMCIGELKQLELLNVNIDIDTYKSLIEKKTAGFIAGAAVCGGIASGMDEEILIAMEAYGYNIGMAFQIKDDILDFTGSEKFGKTKLQDQTRGLKTLPQIIGIESAEEQVRDYSEKAIISLQNIKHCRSREDLILMAKQLEKRDY